MLTAARGGRQLPRPENLNVARRTTRFVIARVGTVARGRSSTCSLTTAVRLSAIAFKQPLLAHMGKPVGVLVRTADELAAVRDGNPFPAARKIHRRDLYSTSSCPLVSTWHESDVLCERTNVCSWCSDVPRRHFNSEQFTFCLNDLAATLWQGHSADGITPRREEGSCLARSDAATPIAR